MSEQNKIPIDEEIVAGWNFYQTNRKIDRPSLLTLVRQARAAGREEQRKLIAESIEHRFASYKNGGNPSYLLGLNDALEICGGSVEAIRAQGGNRE